jgi:uncharacterized membrane protein
MKKKKGSMSAMAIVILAFAIGFAVLVLMLVLYGGLGGKLGDMSQYIKNFFRFGK